VNIEQHLAYLDGRLDNASLNLIEGALQAVMNAAPGIGGASNIPAIEAR
jgi:hypothetical protein